MSESAVRDNREVKSHTTVWGGGKRLTRGSEERLSRRVCLGDGLPAAWTRGDGVTFAVESVFLEWTKHIRWYVDVDESRIRWSIEKIEIGGSQLKKNGKPGPRWAGETYDVDNMPDWLADLFNEYHPEGQRPFESLFAESVSAAAVH
jgi:hypothetical protein